MAKDCTDNQGCAINYEKQSSFNLMVNAMDSGTPQMDVDKQITVNVRDKNDPPYDVQLSSSNIFENATADTLVGTFSAKDEDDGQKLSFTLIDDDSGNFRIDSSANLYKTRTSNYESQKAHFVVVQVQDNGSPLIKVYALHFKYVSIFSSYNYSGFSNSICFSFCR